MTTKNNPAAAPITSAPNWVSDTPDHFTYELSMWVGEGCDEGIAVDNQKIAINRTEFIALKQHLAALRGLNEPN